MLVNTHGTTAKCVFVFKKEGMIVGVGGVKGERES